MVKKSSKLQKNIKYFNYILCFTQTFSILNNTIMNIIPKFILHPLTTSGFHHIQTSQSTFIANQLNGFYMMENIGC